MTEDEAFDLIYNMGKPRSAGWQQSTFPVVKPSRKVLRKAFDVAIKGWDLPEFIQIVQLALQAQQKDRALSLQNRQSISQPVGYAVWLNEERWEIEIQSAVENKGVSRSKKCHCGEDFPCAKHFYDNLKDDWRWSLVNQEWRRLGKPKTQTECIESLRREGKLNLLLIIKRPPGKRGGDPTRMGDL